MTPNYENPMAIATEEISSYISHHLLKRLSIANKPSKRIAITDQALDAVD